MAFLRTRSTCASLPVGKASYASLAYGLLTGDELDANSVAFLTELLAGIKGGQLKSRAVEKLGADS